MPHRTIMSVRTALRPLALALALLASPATAQDAATRDAPALPRGLWLPAERVEELSSMELAGADGVFEPLPADEMAGAVAQSCLEDGSGVFANDVWHRLALDEAEVSSGMLCQPAGEGRALCEALSTDIVENALVPVGTPRPELFVALRWETATSEAMELCMAGQCAAMTRCEPLIEAALAAFGQEGDGALQAVRARLAEPIALIEAETIDVLARAREAGADLSALGPDASEDAPPAEDGTIEGTDPGTQDDFR